MGDQCFTQDHAVRLTGYTRRAASGYGEISLAPHRISATHRLTQMAHQHGIVAVDM